MQELQVKVTQAQVEIIDREKFEQNINEVVTKYQNYTVTAATIKDDKQTLADLRKLDKQYYLNQLTSLTSMSRMPSSL